MSTAPMTTDFPENHSFDSTILREYDIRGIVGTTLSAEDAYFIGKGFATMILEQDNSNKLICVGYDGRLSSPELSNALIEGITSTGADVTNIGIGPTPMLYFAAHHFKAAGAIMVTGSHNPPTHNGFKMMQGTKSFFGSDIQKLGSLVASGNLLKGKGAVTEQSIEEEYLSALAAPLADIENKTDISIAWDAGNGAAGTITEKLISRIPGNHIPLFTEIDGNFPNHHPDPTIVENLQDLIKTVQEKQCDFGVAFDGDGDRIGVVDPKGRIIWGDQLMVLFAKDIIAKNPGATVIADVKASQTLFDKIAEFGGSPIMWKTGHSLVKTKMKETNALVAGEMSGHIFFADEYYGFDDGIYAAVRLIRLAIESDVKLTDIIDSLPQTLTTPEIRIDCGESQKFEAIKAIKERLATTDADVNDVDGVRVRTEDGWWLMRASNTQSCIVARCESNTPEGLKTLKESVREQLKLSGIDSSALN
ncbi:MAG: phosphomannomutase/phosphoglucomutase [Rickettsiales bacterium]|nr:phosphomannomutase/phosphoglucomutase [Rickettsiales bacterium]